MAKLIIRRDRQYADSLRSYEIEVDGVGAASIRAGETIAIDVKQGRHQIRARIDWCGSHPIPLEIEGDGHRVLEVRSNVSFFRLPLAALYISFWKDRYLSLAEADPDTVLWFE